MREFICLAASLMICLGCQASVPEASIESQAKPQGTPTLYAFSDTPAGQPPKGFSFARTGPGAMGQWRVIADAGAPSAPQVLIQQDADRTDARYPIALAEQPSLKNLRLNVKCKALSGQVDQAMGLVFRYLDADNYYLTRANALEGNIRLYRIVRGTRQQLASWSGEVKTTSWHAYQVEVFNDRIEVSWNGQRVLSARDETFAGPGRVGVWTKADSVSAFDDLTVTGLVPKS